MHTCSRIQPALMYVASVKNAIHAAGHGATFSVTTSAASSRTGVK